MLLSSLFVSQTLAEDAKVYIKGGKTRLRVGDPVYENSSALFGQIPDEFDGDKVSIREKLEEFAEEYPDLNFKVKEKGNVS